MTITQRLACHWQKTPTRFRRRVYLLLIAVLLAGAWLWWRQAVPRTMKLVQVFPAGTRMVTTTETGFLLYDNHNHVLFYNWRGKLLWSTDLGPHAPYMSGVPKITFSPNGQYCVYQPDMVREMGWVPDGDEILRKKGGRVIERIQTGHMDMVTKGAAPSDRDIRIWQAERLIRRYRIGANWLIESTDIDDTGRVMVCYLEKDRLDRLFLFLSIPPSGATARGSLALPEYGLNGAMWDGSAYLFATRNDVMQQVQPVEDGARITFRPVTLALFALWEKYPNSTPSDNERYLGVELTDHVVCLLNPVTGEQWQVQVPEKVAHLRVTNDGRHMITRSNGVHLYTTLANVCARLHIPPPRAWTQTSTQLRVYTYPGRLSAILAFPEIGDEPAKGAIIYEPAWSPGQNWSGISPDGHALICDTDQVNTPHRTTRCMLFRW